MNNAQKIANIIRLEMSKRNCSVSKMLNAVGLGRNTMSHLDNGSMIKADSLGKIADYLDVSVDYLLGREEKNATNINTTNNSQIDNSTVIGVSNEKQYDETANELILVFKELSFSDKAKVMSLVAELSEKNKK